MNVLGITLARGGSKGVKNKNVRTVGGKPLLAWTIEQALSAELVDEYVVSTDSDRIAAVARRYGAKVIMRPDELATDESPSIDGLVHALDVCERTYGVEYPLVADIRATNPMKLSDDIDGCIRKLVSSGADTVCGVSKLDDHHPARIKFIVGDRLVDVWPEHSGNRQDLVPDCYIRNGSVYAVRASALREGIHFTGDTRPWVMPPERGINIDSELDVLICEALLTSQS